MSCRPAALLTIEFKSAKADMGCKVERKALSTIAFKSAKVDMGCKNENIGNIQG